MTERRSESSILTGAPNDEVSLNECVVPRPVPRTADSPARALRSKSADTEPPVFEVVFHAGAQPLALGTLRVTDHPGLLSCHVVQREEMGGSAELVSLWFSREHARAYAAQLASVLGLSVRTTREGFVVQTLFKSWWRRPEMWWTIAIHVVALFGALQWVFGVWPLFFSTPAAEFETEGGGPAVEVREDLAMRADVVIRNRSQVAEVKVTLGDIAVKAIDGTSSPLVQDLSWETPVVVIDKGAQATVAIVGAALPPGRYEMTVEAEAKAGLFPAELPLVGVRRVRVWKPLSWSAFAVKIERGASCLLEARLTVGHLSGRGIRGQVSLAEGAPAAIRRVFFPGLLEPADIRPPDRRTSAMWTIPRSETFRDHVFHVEVEIVGPGGSSCVEIAPSLAATFSPTGADVR